MFKGLGKSITKSLVIGIFIGVGILIAYAEDIIDLTQTVDTSDKIKAQWFNTVSTGITDINNKLVNITSIGANVGIGTANPSTKLDVTGITTIRGSRNITLNPSGNIKINGDTGGWANFLHFIGSSGTDRGGFGALGWDDALSYLYAGDSFTNPTMVWKSNNVGIGTTNPGARIESYGSGAGLYLNQATASDLYIRYHIPGVRRWTVGPKANGDFWFSNSSDHSSNYSFGITSGGNVGIGTDSPSQKLHVEGNIYSTGQPTINNGAPTIYFKDTDHRSAMIHNNSNILYILRGDAVNSSTWAAYGGYRPLNINLENNNAQFGGAVSAPGGFATSSDLRLKKDLIKIENPITKIKQLNGYNFTWKNSEKKDLGVIAQEVEQVFPELVSESKNALGESYKTVNYGSLIAPLIEAIKEQQKEIDELKKEINKIKNSR